MGERCGWEGVFRAEGNKGGKWDNCNSIINKIYLKKKERRKKRKHLFPNKFHSMSSNQEHLHQLFIFNNILLQQLFHIM